MFVDKVKVTVEAGKGGDGIVNFRHEIYVDKGGPDGGDGGDGGDVILVASRNQNTLAAFRYNKLLKAPNGMPGDSSRKHGRSAKNMLVPVPVGTIAMLDDGQVIADLTEDNQQVVIARGGRGGFGNAHFVSSVRQAPKVAEKGEYGDKLEYTFELRMLADVGLVGLPNAGKSSLITSVSNAKPEIANYPFTTLKPHLGVVDVDGEAILMADIPGLIAGASQGKGLGDEFLRHVSRCSVLLHMIDSSSNDIAADYKTIRSELEAYSPDMAKKPEIVLITKIENLPEDLIDMQFDMLRKVVPKKTPILKISAYAHKGLNDLLFKLKDIVVAEHNKQQIIAAEQAAALPVIKLKESPDAWTITKTKNAYVITGRKIERFAARTDFNNDFGIIRLRDIMKKMGIMNQLRKEQINPGDRIIIGKPSRGEFTY